MDLGSGDRLGVRVSHDKRTPRALIEDVIGGVFERNVLPRVEGGDQLAAITAA